MAHQTITAVFDSVAEADAASRDLATRIGGVRAAVYTSSTEASELSRLGITGPDRSVLDEAMRRGGVVLSATVPEAQFHEAADIIEAKGAVDLDQRESEWRGSGWSESNVAAHSDTATTATAPATPAQATGTTAATGMGAMSTGSMGTASTSGTARSTGTANTLATGAEERIPVVEEQIRIGKRETAHGRVRIRSYVVETPVQEQVTLHQEHVQVERRPVDRPLEAGATAFQERVIEATETAEEAVVAKEARVKEEVVIRKTADDETRTVQDKVRRTEVEVEDDRQAGATSRTTGTTGVNPTRDR